MRYIIPALCLVLVLLTGCPAVPVVNFDATPLSGPAPLKVRFTNLTNSDAVAGLNSPEWSWNFGDGNSSTDFSPKHTYVNSGDYTVTCTLTTADGLSTLTRGSYIHVDAAAGDKAKLPSVDFSGTPRKGDAPLVVQFTNLTDPIALAALDSPTWLWEFGDGATSTEFSPQHEYATVGKFTVKCTLTDGNRHKKKKRRKYIKVKPAVDVNLVAWSTYFGGNNTTETWDTAVDGDGNLIVAGGTLATDLPTTTGAYDQTHNGSYDIYVAKFSGADGSLLWATYIGGSGYEEVEGLLVLANGTIIVNGVADGTFPAASTTTVGPVSTVNPNIYLLSLSSDGAQVGHVLFFGGQSYDATWERSRIAQDSSGNFVISGYTYSADFPVTMGAYQTQLLGSYDAFVAKVSANLDAVLWATYLGGTGLELGKAVAIDADDAVYVVGSTNSENYPTTEGAYDRTWAGDYDGFVTKLASDGSALVYSTLIGGSARDRLWDIGLTSTKQAIVSGFSSSPDLVLPEGGYDTKQSGGTDILACILSADGSSLEAGTFLGGKGSDDSLGMAIDGMGNVWLSGSTRSSNFPLTTPTFQRKHNGGDHDCYVAALDLSLSTLVFSTYLGGSGDDLDGHISMDADGNPMVAGITQSSDFPTTSGAHQPTYPGVTSVFVTKFNVQSQK